MTNTKSKTKNRSLVTYWKDDGHVFPAIFEVHSAGEHSLMDYYLRLSDLRDDTSIFLTHRGHLRFGLTDVISWQSAYACVAGSIILKPVDCADYTRSNDFSQEFHLFFPLSSEELLTRDIFADQLAACRDLRDLDPAMLRTPLIDSFTNVDSIIEDINNLRLQWRSTLQDFCNS